MTEKKNHGMVFLGIILFLCLGGVFAERVCGQTLSQPAPPLVPYYAAPRQIELCGEPVPLSDPEVWERFDREFTIVVYNHAQVYLWLKRLNRYFPWIEKQLSSQNLPEDLKFVAVAESDLVISAVSPAGAAGPWQFIPSTGRNYGLAQSDEIDQRYDFEMATSSAFRYLKDLYGLFQNWGLAIAAYNCGEKRVADEMRRQRVNSYFLLKLPLETERYVFRILAIKEVLSHPSRYGYNLPEGAGYPEIAVDQVSINFHSPVAVQSVAEAAGMTYREFRMLNPSLTSDTISSGLRNLKVPKGKGKDFESSLAAARPRYQSTVEYSKTLYHKVAKGETVNSIARQYGVSVQDLRAWNDIKGDNVQIGQLLKILR